MVACICHSPLHHQKPDFEGQSVIKASSYLLPFVLEAHRESLPRSCETSARRLSAESAEVYSTADLYASAAHIPFSCNTSCTSRASHYSKSTPSQPLHTLETQKWGSTVKSTSVQWSPLRVSPEYACWEGFQMCLGSVYPEGHKKTGVSRGSSLPTSLTKLRETSVVGTNLAW